MQRVVAKTLESRLLSILTVLISQFGNAADSEFNRRFAADTEGRVYEVISDDVLRIRRPPNSFFEYSSSNDAVCRPFLRSLNTEFAVGQEFSANRYNFEASVLRKSDLQVAWTQLHFPARYGTVDEPFDFIELDINNNGTIELLTRSPTPNPGAPHESLYFSDGVNRKLPDDSFSFSLRSFLDVDNTNLFANIHADSKEQLFLASGVGPSLVDRDYTYDSLIDSQFWDVISVSDHNYLVVFTSRYWNRVINVFVLDLIEDSTANITCQLRSRLILTN